MMHKMMRIWLVTLMVALLAACAATPPIQPSDFEPEAAEEELTEHDRIYYYQHRLLPMWLHDSDGAFFNDLKAGELEHLLNAAAEIIDPEYANAIEVQPLLEQNAALILFPEPKTALLCYFVLVRELDEGYAYYTYERVIDNDRGIVGIVGAWDSEESRYNLGPRAYRDAASFVEDLLGERP